MAAHTYTDNDIYLAADFLKANVPAELYPKVGVICGSGLGGLAGSLENTVEFKYEEIPGFPVSTVAGHAGKLVFGLISGKPTVCMVGRFHFYEGHLLKLTVLPVRVMSLMGVETLFVTNAAGSLNHEKCKVGDIMIIEDHINIPGMAGNNPLIGANLSSFGPRFPPVNDAYPRELRSLAIRAARELDIRQYIREGVYCFVSGPSYESPAEARMMRALGGDVIGMSTVPEVVVARHCGMKVLGFSLVTNFVVTRRERTADEESPEFSLPPEDNVETPNHEEVLAVGNMRSNDMQNLVKKIVELM
ncbi:inosine guanosine and [Basidiobolus meristosporus CBS 931.73]|uniref:Purine nucleoside phosphorylase n=1 Tax=Basidiobolus meristosporus CBS 931.73 TaxID=1314790 RepID=A0A1Y1XVU3_9FUNG|nr:inosine guanosine and [Basidiobolus meristosporus CBS 931.73]ORX89878.1 inosine guanosine and [Basidiobolus meristosporus CBS 931.73]|eukprot:ORX79027.1 inosine guanosine and [Basidiobolus meristosporus CBS 931.73]